jgi:hypothetical protein
MICIDNAHGCGVGIAVGSEKYHVAENNGITVYGWSPIPDCAPDGSWCTATDKFGIDVPACGAGGQKLHPPKEKKMPYTLTSGGEWAGEIKFINNNFINFTEITIAGKAQRLFGMGADPDYHCPVYFIGNMFNNVAMNSMFTLPDPNPGWANIKDCGNFPCTAPKNILLDFRDTTYTGANQPVTGSDF